MRNVVDPYVFRHGATEAVFVRSLGHPDSAGLDEQVAVGRSDIDEAGTEALAVPGVVSRQHTRTAQNRVENARRLGRGMQNDAARGDKILGQSLDGLAKRLNSA